MCDITNLNSSELIAFASTLSIYIGQNVTSEEASILANFFSALGDNLGIISSTPSKHANNSNNCSSC